MFINLGTTKKSCKVVFNRHLCIEMFSNSDLLYFLKDKMSKNVVAGLYDAHVR